MLCLVAMVQYCLHVNNCTYVRMYLVHILSVCTTKRTFPIGWLSCIFSTTYFSRFGGASIIGEGNCNGNENALLNCGFTTSHDCLSTEAVGIQCSECVYLYTCHMYLLYLHSQEQWIVHVLIVFVCIVR